MVESAGSGLVEVVKPFIWKAGLALIAVMALKLAVEHLIDKLAKKTGRQKTRRQNGRNRMDDWQ